MTIYRGLPPHIAMVDDAPLEHRVHHSPTGFSWGYGGSGPADLARSILWDHLGREPAPACYQEFKFDVVAQWPADAPWSLTDMEVAEWLADYVGPFVLEDDRL